MATQIGLALAFLAIMGTLIWGYVDIVWRVQHDRDEALHRLAVSIPTTVSGSGSAGCAHFSIGGNFTSVSCGICGALELAA